LHDVCEFCGTCDRYPGADGEITVDASVVGGSPVGGIRVTESLVKMGGVFQGWRGSWVGECWAGGEGDCETTGDRGGGSDARGGGRGMVCVAWIQRSAFVREKQNVGDDVVVCNEETELVCRRGRNQRDGSGG
jgi:hypothetical protein